MLRRIFSGPQRAKWVALLLAAMFFASLTPIFAISVYARPALDDYLFSSLTHETWTRTHSIWAVLRSAAAVTSETYRSWQGSYTAIFLFTLQTGLFSEHLYWIGLCINLVLFLISNLYFFSAFLPRMLKLDRWQSLSVAVLLTTIFLQLLPSAAQGFYWHCAVSCYLFFHSLSLLLAGMLCKSAAGPRKRYLVLAPLVAFLAAGSNYSTLLSLAVLFALYMGYLLFWKKRNTAAVVACAAYFSGLLINVLAPGNGARMLEYGVSIGAAESVVQSLTDTANLICQWTSAPFVLLELCTVPFLWRAAKAARFRFRFPLLVTVGSYLFIAVGLTPLIYGYGEISAWATRVYNILFFQYAILACVNLFYLLGWLHRVLGEAGGMAAKAQVHPAQPHADQLPHHTFTALIALAALVAVFSWSSIQTQYYGFRLSRVTSVSALVSLRDGGGAAYAREMDARLPALNDDSQKNPTFPPLTAEPYVLHILDIDENPGNWVNAMVAGYYGKDSVALTQVP